MSPYRMNFFQDESLGFQVVTETVQKQLPASASTLPDERTPHYIYICRKTEETKTVQTEEAGGAVSYGVEPEGGEEEKKEEKDEEAADAEAREPAQPADAAAEDKANEGKDNPDTMES
eukprot:GHVU01202264.1.p3 GENE.GHVU01202264.1~~GHVU01202264.1.p3  ORF type:complete len:118 (-),score=35.47 GHVU01202264.1:87-440(-)